MQLSLLILSAVVASFGAGCDALRRGNGELEAWAPFPKTWVAPPAETDPVRLFAVAVFPPGRQYVIAGEVEAVTLPRAAGRRAHRARYEAEGHLPIDVTIARMTIAQFRALYEVVAHDLPEHTGYYLNGGLDDRWLEYDGAGRGETFWWGAGWLFSARTSAAAPRGEFLRQLLLSGLEPPRKTTKPKPRPGQPRTKPPPRPTIPETPWRRQPSYTGDCGKRPPGFRCIRFGDGYRWLVEGGISSWRQAAPHQGKKVTVGVWGHVEFHHVEGTDLVREVTTRRR